MRYRRLPRMGLPLALPRKASLYNADAALRGVYQSVTEHSAELPHRPRTLRIDSEVHPIYADNERERNEDRGDDGQHPHHFIQDDPSALVGRTEAGIRRRYAPQ